ncbi:hypothetical protein GCM10027074_05250 [Streptomyces deserti]
MSPPRIRVSARSSGRWRIPTVQGSGTDSDRGPPQGEIIMARTTTASARATLVTGLVATLAATAVACGPSASDDEDPDRRAFDLDGRTFTVGSDDSALEIVAADDNAEGKVEVTRWFEGSVTVGDGPELRWSMDGDRLVLRTDRHWASPRTTDPSTSPTPVGRWNCAPATAPYARTSPPARCAPGPATARSTWNSAPYRTWSSPAPATDR